MTLGSRLAPDAAVKAAAHRVRMAAAARGLNGDAGAGPVARALRSTALGRFDSDEREWAARIAGRREQVASLAGHRTPEETGVFDVVRAVRWMSVPPVLGLLLMRLVRELSPTSCLELGTGFGISAAYMAAALELNAQGRLVSIDIDPRPARIAREGLEALGLRRVDVRTGDDDDVSAALAEFEPVEFAFVDADHRGSKTVESVERVLPRLAPGAVIVLDDVDARWAGMAQAWQTLAAHPRAAWTRHLGRLGILGLRTA